MPKSMSHEELRDRVRESLDHAVANGYDNMLINSPKEMAADLSEYDGDVEGYSLEVLERLVAEWLGDHAKEASATRARLLGLSQ